MGEYMMDQERTVFVIHGRNAKARKAMFNWLRTLHLEPLEWEEAVNLTKSGSPTTLEVVKAGLSHAQVVLALLTDDEQVRLRPELRGKSVPFEYQSRPNVIFEAGMACALSPKKTVFVELGNVRRFSDVDGVNTIRMGREPDHKALQRLKNRLCTAGCAVKLYGEDWLDPQIFADVLFSDNENGTVEPNEVTRILKYEEGSPAFNAFQSGSALFSENGEARPEVDSFLSEIDCKPSEIFGLDFTERRRFIRLKCLEAKKEALGEWFDFGFFCFTCIVYGGMPEEQNFYSNFYHTMINCGFSESAFDKVHSIISNSSPKNKLMTAVRIQNFLKEQTK